MGPKRAVILGVALTAAVGVALIVRGMAQGQAAPVAPVAAVPAAEKPLSEVLVAKRDLPPGTTLVEEDLTWQAWPQEAINPLFITKAGVPKPPEGEGAIAKVAVKGLQVAKQAVSGPEAALLSLVGAVVREPILANEPMTQRKLVRAGTAGIMAISLDAGMRAIAVPLSAESAAGGFILPGDHVDVVQSRQVDVPGGTGGKRFVSSTMLKNVKVLAIDQATGAKEAAVVGATATLEVTSNQAEVLVMVKAQGELTLVLRSYADISGPAVTSLPTDGDDVAIRAAVVQVFRNGRMTEQQVTQ